MSEVINHLLQSTIFAGLAALAAVSLRRTHAKARYWLWLAASLQFLVPFSLLVMLGSRVEAPAVQGQMPALVLEQITTPFAPVPAMHSTLPHNSAPAWPTIALWIWAAGTLLVIVRWARKWLVMRRARRNAVPLPMDAPLPVLSSYA